MTKLNKNIANALGMELPDEVNEELETNVPALVEPHAIVEVDNPNLPEMSDINERLHEAETQMDQFIDFANKVSHELYDELGSLEPRFRARNIEVMSTIMRQGLDAIKTKTKTQMEKKKSRMDEQKYENNGGGGGSGINVSGSNVTVVSGQMHDVMESARAALKAQQEEEAMSKARNVEVQEVKDSE